MISIEKYIISAAVYKVSQKDVITTAEGPDKEVISVVEIHEDSGWDKSVLECQIGRMDLFENILKVKLWALLIGSEE